MTATDGNRTWRTEDVSRIRCDPFTGLATLTPNSTAAARTELQDLEGPKR